MQGLCETLAHIGADVGQRGGQQRGGGRQGRDRICGELHGAPAHEQVVTAVRAREAQAHDFEEGGGGEFAQQFDGLDLLPHVEARVLRAAVDELHAAGLHCALVPPRR
ncbi:hypothetical protein [Azoarcus sp. CIB]|uniref:hypothetical protein n=1 Tax=Aromatoleum sp. (strain CIB) TaxID=198107 RepID=UPI00067B3B8B|nr:hypothetical protein [Azoarcus sp. CIB]